MLCNPNSCVLVFCSDLWDNLEQGKGLVQMPNGSVLDYLEEEVVVLKSCRFDCKSDAVV